MATDPNALVQWDPNSGAALPAYLADAAAAFGSNIPDRMNVPSLSYEGKVWTIVKDGNKTKLTKRNDDGDEEPVSIMRMVIVGVAPDRGRAYYPGSYNPQQVAAPVCWSSDGKTPDAGLPDKVANQDPNKPHKISPACQGCPMSIKGSKIQDGREMIACSQYRLLGLVPAFDLEFEPLRLKIAVTSDYDKEVVEHGWFAFRQYGDFLKSRGIPHTGMVVTKVKFDNQAAYPKLLFALDRPLTQVELAKSIALKDDPRMVKLITESWTPAGVNGTPSDDSDIRPDDGSAAIARAEADGWVKHPTPGYHYKGQDVVETVELAARYPAPEPAAPPAAPATPAAAMTIEGTATVVEAPAAPAPEPAAPPHDPIVAAEADGWVKHPDAPGYHYKGQEVVATGDLAARYPAPAASASEPAAPPAPPAAPEPAPAADPLAAARADGWIAHPDAPGFHYKGQEVVADADLAARYASAPTPAAAPEAPVANGAAPTADAGAIPADVQNLLDQWTTQ